MDNMDLREVQSAITKMILRADPGFLIDIERTFIFEGKVLMICKDEKTLEWTKHVVEAIVLSLVAGPARGGFRGYIVPGPGPGGARAQGAWKSSGFCVKFWYRTITP